MKTINIQCDGGFGNRFNGLVTGLFLSQRYNLRPLIFWPLNNQVGAKFDQIFNSDLEVREQYVIEQSKSDQTINVLHDNYINKNKSWVNTHSDISIIDQAVVNGNKDIVFATATIPNYVDINFVKYVFSRVQFKDSITQTVADVLSTKPKTFYGIHLRRTDFLGHYRDINEVVELLVQNNTQLFFVCSDDKQAEETICKLPNVFNFPKQHYVEKLAPGDWNTEYTDAYGQKWPYNVNRKAECVIEGLVDLLILSKSDLRYSTGFSTFLQTARILQHCFNEQE